MPEPILWDALSEAGLPVGASLLAWGLVRGADALEADAKEERLKSISKLLKKGPLTAFGTLGSAVVPLIFDNLFGASPFSRKFIARSFLVSLLFWMILILIKRPVWPEIMKPYVLPFDLDYSKFSFGNFFEDYFYVVLFGYSFPLIALLIDWISLVKSRLLLNVMRSISSLLWTFVFVVLDILLTYILSLLVFTLYISFLAFAFSSGSSSSGSTIDLLLGIPELIFEIFEGGTNSIPIVQYLNTEHVTSLSDVLYPSTMLTSVWVILFLISSMVGVSVAMGTPGRNGPKSGKPQVRKGSI